MKILVKKILIFLFLTFIVLNTTGCSLIEKYFPELLPLLDSLKNSERIDNDNNFIEIPEDELKPKEEITITTQEPEPKPEETNIVLAPEIIEEPIYDLEPEPVLIPVLPVTHEPEIIEEPIVEPEPEELVIEEPEIDEEEYLRSIDNLDATESVTKVEFNEDKNAILSAISDLSNIMETKDVNKWLEYIEPDSIEYYSNPVNLRKAQKKLPNKTVVLKDIEDYFNYVFIPSRQRSQVDEIRYISKISIKAVQVKEDKSIVVYYYFTKVGNKWLIHLPII